MWFLYLITILNGVANNKTFLDYRFDLFGFPVNSLDVLVFGGLLLVVFWPRSARMPAPMHRGLKWLMVFFVAGLFSGFVGTMSNGADAREIVTFVRNYMSMGAAVLLGYGLLNRPSGSKWFSYAQLIAGVLTALMILLFFTGQGENSSGASSNVNILRTVQYVSPYAGISAVFLLFMVIGGYQYLPKALCLVIASFCLLGQFATLSRSDWLGTAFALMASFWFLPRGARKAAAIKTAVVVSLMGVVLIAGTELASRIMGWDFASKMEHRLISVLPGVSSEEYGKNEAKAWDSRWPSALRELELYTEHPLFGAGYGATSYEARTGVDLGAYNHNAWTAELCAVGPFGFTFMAMVVGFCIVLGKRLLSDRFDQYSVITGALALVTGLFYLIYGASTMSFNIVRTGIPMGMVCGLVLRARAMQQAQMQQQVANYGNDMISVDPWPAGFAVTGHPW